MAQPDNTHTVFSEIRQLKALVAEVSASLRSQRDILQKRGMNLPPGALQTLSGIESDFDKLEAQLISDQTELGQLRTLTETGSMLNSSLNLDTVLTQAMDQVILLTQAERGYIILWDAETQELDFRVARENEMSRHDGKNQVSQTILQEVLTSGEPILADNAYKDPRMQDKVSIAQMVLRSVMCMPLTYKGTVTGAVYVDNRLRAGVFSERELNLLKAFANQAAVAIENARLYTRIQITLAEITELKDLMNNVFASIGSGVVTTDEEYRITTFNPAAAEILDTPPEELPGQSLRQVLSRIDELNFDEMLQTARAAQGGFQQSAILESAARGELHVSVKATPLRDERQEAHGLTLVLDDISAQHEREARLDVMRKYLPGEMVDKIHLIASLALGGERREITCMFIEVRAVSTLPADMRPSEVMHTMNEYLGVATEVVQAHGGIIDKYMGSELMVLFNTQLNPAEAHAFQAVECALGLRQAFLKMYARLGINPQPHFYRMGLNTGVATLGNVGSNQRRDFTAIGDNINLAKRLEENAAYGQIILSEDALQHIQQTQGALPAHIRFDEREPLQVKGRKQLTRAYEVFNA
ncbi:MAG: adenylate/guanylate cyclase domain-containing protein [Chloroflexi bacterium]|nr:adenylate/guanylate cyclase domain-containing protein [Chloroflexota bacterium]